MAQTLKFGNKVWAAKEDSVLAYNDINNNYKPLPFDFARASIGTRVNKDGLIETMGQDIARIDYTDSADGVLLLEPASTNLVTYSEDFSQSAWTKSNTSITSNSTISPDGNLNADSIVGNGASGLHYILNSVTVSFGQNYTFSIFAKVGTNNFFQLNMGGAPFGSTNYCNFNLSNGTIGSFGNTTSNRFIEKLGNNWYRIGFTATPLSSGSANFFPMLITSATSSFLETNTLDTSVQIYGAQLEALSYSTSYIATSGSTVTRAAETCLNSGNSEVFNDSEGVLFANVNFGVNQPTSRYFAISDGTNDNRIQLGRGTSASNLSFFVKSNGSSTIGVIINEGTGEVLKLAVKYKPNDYSIWSNGFEIYQNSTVSSTPLNISKLNFAVASGVGGEFYGKTKELGYYDTALTDAELETLTSYRNWVSMVNELNLNIIYNG